MIATRSGKRSRSENALGDDVRDQAILQMNDCILEHQFAFFETLDLNWARPPGRDEHLDGLVQIPVFGLQINQSRPQILVFGQLCRHVGPNCRSRRNRCIMKLIKFPLFPVISRFKLEAIRSPTLE